MVFELRDTETGEVYVFDGEWYSLLKIVVGAKRYKREQDLRSKRYYKKREADPNYTPNSGAGKPRNHRKLKTIPADLL